MHGSKQTKTGRAKAVGGDGENWGASPQGKPIDIISDPLATKKNSHVYLSQKRTPNHCIHVNI